MSTRSIAAEKYVRLTTFTRDGRPKPVPVWIADLGDGTVGFTTELDSWKVKRMRNTPAVELTPSDARGRVDDTASTATGHAAIVTDADVDRVAAAIKAKYGFQVTLIQGVNKLRGLFGRGGGPSCGVVITLD